MCNYLMAAKNVNLCDNVKLCIWEGSVRGGKKAIKLYALQSLYTTARIVQGNCDKETATEAERYSRDKCRR